MWSLTRQILALRWLNVVTEVLFTSPHRQMSKLVSVSCNKSRVLFITPNMSLDAARRPGGKPINGSMPARSDLTTVVARRRVMPVLGVFWQMVRIYYRETQITITLTSIHTNIPATLRLPTCYTSKADAPKLFHARWKKEDLFIYLFIPMGQLTA